MVTKSSREMQKDREKIRPPFGGLKFCQGTHYLPLTIKMTVACCGWFLKRGKYEKNLSKNKLLFFDAFIITGICEWTVRKK